MKSLHIVSFILLIGYHNCLEPPLISLGVLVTEDNNQIKYPLNSIIYRKNGFDRKAIFRTSVQEVSKYNSFEASSVLCNVLKDEDGVAAVFGTDSPTSGILRSINEHFNMPYLITSWTPSSNEKDNTVINFFPEAQLFAQGLADVVKSLHWNSFVILYETEEGLIRMQKILNLQEYKEGTKRKNIFVKQLEPGSNHRLLLKEIKKLREINIILDCKTEHILPILTQAKEIQLLDIFSKVFLTSLDSHSLDFTSLNTSANITTIRLFNESNDLMNSIENWQIREFRNNDHVWRFPKLELKTETILFHDALLLLTDSLNGLTSEMDIRTNPISCNGNTPFPHGYTIVADMKSRNASLSLSGPLEFDEYGNRINFNLSLVYINKTRVDEIAVWNAKEQSLYLTRNSNDTDNAITANLQSINVQVYTKKGKPYFMEKEDSKNLTGNDRYEGFSVDLITEIAKLVNFNFTMHVTKNNEYGSYDEEKNRWTGLVGDLLEKRAHLAICDLTITHQRRGVVDFSIPFMSLGIGILYKEPDKEEVNRFAFLDPFSISVWIYTATLYLLITIALYFTARLTPGDWEKPYPSDENVEELENMWDLKNCFWLTLGSIMTQGSDILTKGISSRTLVSMWWFFSLVMANSYMANLTAFLTKNRMEPTITGAEALSKQTKIKYGAVAGGSTQAFFRDSTYPTYARMWVNMQSASPSVFVKTNEDGVHKVETSTKATYAFLMESTQIEYEIETRCNLKQVGDQLDSKSYGIAMPLNAPYRTLINKAILRLQENGKLAQLKETWWKKKRKEPSCNRETNTESDGSDLNLTNVGGAFMVLGVGLVIAIVLGVSGFLWNVRSLALEEHVSYWEALKVEVYFACAIWIKKKKVKPIQSDSSSSSSNDTKNIINIQS